MEIDDILLSHMYFRREGGDMGEQIAPIYKGEGGVVTRTAPRKYKVHAPDGRLVGTFRSRSAAIDKATHWDKYDALASLQDVCFTLYPCSTALAVKTMLSECKDIPNEQQLTAAIIADVMLFILRDLYAENTEPKEQ